MGWGQQKMFCHGFRLGVWWVSLLPKLGPLPSWETGGPSWSPPQSLRTFTGGTPSLTPTGQGWETKMLLGI